ncbi:methyl-accepting chemotaxis protein [Pseudogulbenkiania subflava]|uniref:Methyl-accepting chemotaxis protein n=1 Tax=Pseudogulbenkiania subflava DSM 22618 TaxID=1123014 RepID=A0A1Y6CGS7_9NEIS|nr:HAMP domain-containing methyl-accepting chemotaxis protein [Pseudogulbenkiania subflava]SMF52314.1 methyl-accepting chemotaxis protein [Pseudogulbenkiania subflava DSM 22618]
MKIAHRLMILIAAAIIGSVFIGGMALQQLGTVHQSLKTVNEDTIPSLRKLDNLIIELLAMRTSILNHILTTDSNQIQQLDSVLKQQRQTLNKALKDYEGLIGSDERDLALFKASSNSLQGYLKEADKAVELSGLYRKDEAYAKLNQLKVLGDQTVAALNQELEYKVQQAQQRSDSADSTVQQAKLIVGGAVLAILLLTGLLGWLIARQISVGLANAQGTISAIESSLDFTRRAEVRGNDEVSQTLQAFNQLIARLQDSLRNLQAGVQEVGQTSSELLGASQQVAKSSGAQSESSSHMAASVEQMTVSISHVAERAGEASQLSSEAGDRAESGRQVIGQTVSDIHSIAAAVDTAAEDIRQLDAKSKEIASVINVIRDVADQTNLLALNAAIEAARAGESGRGFAVVADEVRKLAERTAASTQEIGTIIGAIQNVSGSAVERMQHAVARVEQGVSGANSAQQSMGSISESSGHSVRLVAEITSAIREQGEATTTIAQQVEQVARMAEENSSAATQAAALAERLEEVSGRMRQVVSAYRL